MIVGCDENLEDSQNSCMDYRGTEVYEERIEVVQIKRVFHTALDCQTMTLIRMGRLGDRTEGLN